MNPLTYFKGQIVPSNIEETNLMKRYNNVKNIPSAPNVNNYPVVSSPFLPNNNRSQISMANNRRSNPLFTPVSNRQNIAMANNRPVSTQKNTPPNYRDNLLNMILSPEGTGYAQGLLEAGGYSKMPVSFSQAMALGQKRANENVAREDAKNYREAVLGIKEDELGIKKENLEIQKMLADAKANAPVKANTQTYVDKKGNTLTLDLNNPDDQKIMQTEGFKNNFVEMSLQTDETPTVIPNSVSNNVSEQFGNTKTLVENITDYQTQLTNPEALTSSSLTNFVITVDNIKELTKQAGGLFKDNTGNEQSNIDDFFAKTEKTLDNKIQTNNAGITGILKSTAVQIAYDYAKQNNPDGRISERDFDNALKILTAGGISNKNALILNAERLKNNAVRSFKNNITGIKGANNLGENTFSNLILDLDTEIKNSPFATTNNNQESTESATSITIDLDDL